MAHVSHDFPGNSPVVKSQTRSVTNGNGSDTTGSIGQQTLVLRLLEVIFQAHAGVIVQKDLLIAASRLSHGLCAVLAHAHPVSIAPGLEKDLVSHHTDSKYRGAQAQKAAQLLSGEGNPSNLQGIHPAPSVAETAPNQLSGEPDRSAAGFWERMRAENSSVEKETVSSLWGASSPGLSTDCR